MESFLLPPYYNAAAKSAEDDFNFFHSSARITVEYAFGEIEVGNILDTLDVQFRQYQCNH